MLEVAALAKTYRVPKKTAGLWGSIRSLWAREHEDVRAVDGIDLHIEPGERVGFLGPNGAGKTTTLKMLTGLLHPTSGTVTVDGYVPQDRQVPFLQRITLVMGQKQQLIWDLPPSETFLLNRALYDLDPQTYRDSRDELVELLQLADVMDKPARNLSLGQRMRAELAVALLHRPSWLFLDEPTIGLDVQVQAQVRTFVKAYSQRHGATVMLTSHDMNDVSALVDRLILIDEGRLRFDGSLASFTEQFGGGRRLVVRGSPEQPFDLSGEGLERNEDGTWSTLGSAEKVNRVLSRVLARHPDADVTVADPPLEKVLSDVFDGREPTETTEITGESEA